MRFFWTILLLLVAVPAGAATLEKLSLEEMIQKSTAIVRGRATGLRTVARGPVIYTLYQVQVAEQWKGPAAAQVEVAVPGGAMNGLRQTFSGAPNLQEGTEYVLFLWTGRNGLTQVIGLSQGKFELSKDEKGDETLHRAAAANPMIDSHGRPVEDAPLRMSLRRLNERIRFSLAGQK
jgi:hypothetical protein